MFDVWSKFRARHNLGLPRLRLPESATARHPNALTHPRELKSWLSKLRDQTPLRACKSMLAQAILLARYPGALAKLSDLLQLFEEPVRQLQVHVGELIREPRTEARDRAAEQLLPVFSRLTNELGHLQKRLINELMDTPKGPSAATLVTTLELLAWQVRIDLTRYRTTPPAAWRDMLQVYQVAEFAQHQGTAVKRADTTLINAHDLFFGTLIFLLCDPLRFSQQQTWALFQYAITRAETVEFTTEKPTASDLPVDLSGTIPPLLFARNPKLKTPGPRQQIAIGRLLRSLANDIDDARAGWLRAALHGLLSNNERARQRRAEPRVMRDTECRMYIGLTSIHARLAQIAGPGHTIDEVRPRHLTCRQFDYSPSGAGFVLDPHYARYIGINELILLERQSRRDAKRSIGFVARVSRLLLRDNERLEVGVRRVPGRLKPIEVKDRRQSGPGLLQQPNDSDLYLIASENLLRYDDRLTLCDALGELQLTVQVLSPPKAVLEPVPIKVISRLKTVPEAP